jgi:hypothetical protein
MVDGIRLSLNGILAILIPNFLVGEENSAWLFSTSQKIISLSLGKLERATARFFPIKPQPIIATFLIKSS